MKFKDMLENLSDFWKEFRKVKSGLVGVAILLFFLVLGLFGDFLVPFPGATSHWRDINFWQDNAQSAPPVWTNLFTRDKGVKSSVISESEMTEESMDNGVRVQTYEFTYDYTAQKQPRDMIVTYMGSGQMPVIVTIERPDGLTAELFREQLDLTENEAQRLSIQRNCAQNTIEFVRAHQESVASTMDAGLIKPLQVLFSKMDANIMGKPAVLNGKYKILVKALLLTEDSKVENFSIVVSGHIAGIMGTDAQKRDVFTGLVVGVRWALIIGILTSVLTVMVGVILGVLAAYFGGTVDWLLSRLYELVYLMPVLPFLIVVSAIFKPSIWTLIVLICVFFWTGAFKPVYGMALQIKEETFVEASKALGSGKWRIIFKHIIPILLPYTFAVMALSIPGVIVYEASISLLGLGDPTIVTWGQILNDANRQGAVINNLWWWVVPPGLSIAFMGMSFAFIGTALDKILHPKLKTR